MPSGQHPNPEHGAGPVASIRRLSIRFTRLDGSSHAVVDGVDLDVREGEVLGVVGESGSGKSLTARTLLRLLPPTARVEGVVEVCGQRILELDGRQLRKLRGNDVAMVFQDPMTSFNPVRTIGDQIGEALAIHSRWGRRSIGGRVGDLLASVGIVSPKARARDYPKAFSGGMRQRAMIAMALANEPKLLVADEPTTALDATVQDQVLDLLRKLNSDLGTAIVLITHNIAAVASLCERVVVMYCGQVIEDAPVERILSEPQHPYTWMLLRSVPRLDVPVNRLTAIRGAPPDPADRPGGCRFHPRCPFAVDTCRQDVPSLEPSSRGGMVRCFVRMEAVSREEQARAG